MKTGLMALMILSSVNAFADKVDMGDKEYPKQILNETNKTFLEFGYSSQGLSLATIQFKRNVSARTLSLGHPSCSIFEDALSRSTPIQDMKLEINGADSVSGLKTFIVDKNNKTLMSCRRISSINDLKDVFTTKSLSTYDIHLKDYIVRTGAIELKGISEDENPEALVSINGSEEFIPCEDLMITNAKNGELETDLSAFSRDILDIVDVVAIGNRNAKVKTANGDQVVKSIEDLSAVTKSTRFSENDKLYIKENNKKVRVTLKGETKIEGVRKILVLHNNKIQAMNTDEVFKLLGPNK